MDESEITIGTSYVTRIGRNEVSVRVVGYDAETGWLVETPSGKQMTIRDAGRFLAPAVQAETLPEPAETNAGTPAEPETPPAEVEQAAAKPEPAAAKPAKAPRPSLLNAAADILRDSAQAMGCSDIVKVAAESGRWTPPKAGKTPAATLSAAIGKEIKTKGDASRFQKVGPGKFSFKG